jgi:hypothetical protein
MAPGKCEAALARRLRKWPIHGVTLTQRIGLAAAFPLIFAAVGCGAQAGGQTGEETDGGCVFAISALTLQQPSPLGFSAGEVLALAEGEQSASFSWLQSPGVAYGPESGVGQVSLRTTAIAPAKFARVDAQRSLAHCVDHVTIPVSIALVTAGGALDESFTADLIATTPDEGVVSALVRSSVLRGAFAFDPDTLSGRRFTRLEVNLRFRSAGSAGYLVAGIESGDQAGGSASFQPLPLACWGNIPALSSPACGD